ncbi:MAG: MFS transporter [Acidimicrobiia bacterium]
MAGRPKFIVDVTPLRESDEFRWLYAGLALAGIGRQLTVVAVPFQVFELTGSTFLVGLLGLIQLGPLLLASGIGGAVVDAMDRRTLLIFAQLTTGLTAVGLAYNAALDEPAVWAIFALSALNAGLATLDYPTRSALVAGIVGRKLLPSATALTQTLENVSKMVGPAIGGAIIATGGFTATYVVEAVAFGIGAMLMLKISRRPAEGGARQFGLESIKEGWVFLRHRKLLQANFYMDINAMVLGMPTALFPAIGTVVLGGDATTVGLLYAAPGAGALAAAFTSGWVGSVKRQGRAVIIAVIVWGASVAAFGLSRSLPLVLLFLAIGGGADVISAVFRNTILQLAAPDNLRGRLSSIHVGVSSGGPRLGDFRAGTMASLINTPFSVVSGGVAVVVGALFIARKIPELNAYVDDDDGGTMGPDAAKAP